MQAMFGLSKFNVRNVSFDAIVAGTVTNYDLALSQVSITPDRAKVVSFSTPYFESQQGVLTKADDSHHHAGRGQGRASGACRRPPPPSTC